MYTDLKLLLHRVQSQLVEGRVLLAQLVAEADVGLWGFWGLGWVELWDIACVCMYINE